MTDLHTDLGQVTTIPATKRERKKLLRRFPGLVYQTAVLHGFDKGFANKVWNRRKTSRDVAAALLTELNRRMHQESLQARRAA